MNKYPIIKKNKKWWKGLGKRDKKAFLSGFNENRQAEEIQKKEIEFNKNKLLRNYEN